MKKLFYLLITITFALQGMENDNSFQSFKTLVETSVAKCKNIADNTERLKQWKTEYETLYNQLPNTQEKLDSLLQKAADESYTNPIFLYLVNIKKTQAQPGKKQTSWSLKSLFSKTEPEQHELTGHIPTPTDNDFQNLVVQTMQNFNLILPYTFLGNLILKNERNPILHNYITFQPIPYKPKRIQRFSGKIFSISSVSSIDLNYLSFVSNIDELSIGWFTGMQLNSIPDDLSRLDHLTTLVLIQNNLTDLPKSIENLTKLKVLALGKNKFQNVPEVITALPSLETLAMQHNNIIDITDDSVNQITQLNNLINLDLSSNQLTKFDLQRIPQSLESLRLDKNNLEDLGSTSKNSQLINLTLNDNKLKKLPHILENSHLQNLTLDHNQLEEFPLIPDDSQLKFITFHNNEFKEIPMEHLMGLKCLKNFTYTDKKTNTTKLIKINSLSENSSHLKKPQ